MENNSDNSMLCSMGDRVVCVPSDIPLIAKRVISNAETNYLCIGDYVNRWHGVISDATSFDGADFSGPVGGF